MKEEIKNKWKKWKHNFLQHLGKWNYYTGDEKLERGIVNSLSPKPPNISFTEMSDYDKNCAQAQTLQDIIKEIKRIEIYENNKRRIKKTG